MARPTRVLVVVPAFNEQASIAAVVAEVVEALPDADVLVVDDCSTDRTRHEALATPALVLTLPINLGVGGAMRAGYRYALRYGYDAVLQIDGDGQHDARDAPRLLAALADADVVIGARFAGVGDYDVKGPRRWAMRLLASTLSRAAHTRLTDVTSGYRACSTPALRLFARHYPAEYLGDTVEALVIVARAGLRVTQVPVSMRPRVGGTPSQSPVKAAVYLVRACLALLLARFRRYDGIERREIAGMSEIEIVSAIGGAVVLGLMVELLRRRQLKEKYAVLWLAVAVGMAVVAVFPGLLDAVAGALSVADPVNLLLFVGMLVLLLVCVHLSWESSRLEDETRALAEEVGLLRLELERRSTGT